MPTLQQTAVVLAGAVTHLQALGAKPGSSGMTELGNSAGSVFNYLREKAALERQVVGDAVNATADTLKVAKAKAKETKAAIGAADGKKAVAAAELDAAKADAAVTVAKVATGAAETHAKAAAPADKQEDAATDHQAKAELARTVADKLKAEGQDAVAGAQDEADEVIAEAEKAYDLRMTDIENEVKSALGV